MLTSTISCSPPCRLKEEEEAFEHHVKHAHTGRGPQTETPESLPKNKAGPAPPIDGGGRQDPSVRWEGIVSMFSSPCSVKRDQKRKKGWCRVEALWGLSCRGPRLRKGEMTQIHGYLSLMKIGSRS
jgi:hypothetical protein